MKKKTTPELLKWLDVPIFSEEMLTYAKKYGLPKEVQIKQAERFDEQAMELLRAHMFGGPKKRCLCKEVQKELFSECNWTEKVEKLREQLFVLIPLHDQEEENRLNKELEEVSVKAEQCIAFAKKVAGTPLCVEILEMLVRKLAFGNKDALVLLNEQKKAYGKDYENGHFSQEVYKLYVEILLAWACKMAEERLCYGFLGAFKKYKIQLPVEVELYLWKRVHEGNQNDFKLGNVNDFLYEYTIGLGLWKKTQETIAQDVIKDLTEWRVSYGFRILVCLVQQGHCKIEADLIKEIIVAIDNAISKDDFLLDERSFLEEVDRELRKYMNQ